MKRKPDARRELEDGYGPPEPWSPHPIVAINPLADEAELLARIGVSGEECVRCDLWWAHQRRLVFVSVEFASSGSGVSYHRAYGGRYMRRRGVLMGDRFSISTGCQPIQRAHVVAALAFLEHWTGVESHRRLMGSLPRFQTVVRISDEDVCRRAPEDQRN